MKTPGHTGVDYVKGETGPPPWEGIPDVCGRAQMTRAAHLAHIRSCRKPSCMEVWRNHLELIDHFRSRRGPKWSGRT